MDDTPTHIAALLRPRAAYGAAVVASCSLAIGLNQIAKKVQPKNVSVLKGALIRASVPYVAVVGKRGCSA
jgi:hypothetical protein